MLLHSKRKKKRIVIQVLSSGDFQLGYSVTKMIQLRTISLGCTHQVLEIN